MGQENGKTVQETREIIREDEERIRRFRVLELRY